MTDDEIRVVVRELGRVTSGTPAGFVRVARQEIAERADVGTVAVWIANNGGLVEGPHPEASSVPGEDEPSSADDFFLVPQRALDGD